MVKVFNRRTWTAIIIVFILLAGLYHYPLPYFVSHPGDAIDIGPLVTVENGYDQEGTFMLTTIRMGGANLYTYLWAKFSDYVELITKKSVLAGFENERDYHRYQQITMERSKEKAIIAAYRLAGHRYDVVNHGVIVATTLDGLPAKDIFRTGDMITHIDDLPVHSVEELNEYIKSKSEGEQITVTFIRDQTEQEVILPLAVLSSSDGSKEKRIGIGIGAITERSVITEPPVEIETKRIGGPSAGLMFALQIYNQLTSSDLTKGYRIAGTGTIEEDGQVGRIGGIHQKVVAADRAGADIFFAPREEGNPDSNYEEARRVALEIGSQTDIVPVDTILDALHYLEQLPEKKAG